MTRQETAGGVKLLESDPLALSDPLVVTRRDVIAAGAAGLALLANFNGLALADEGGSTGGGEPEQQQQKTDYSMKGSAPATEQKPEARAENYSDIMMLLGGEFRGRASGIQDLTSHQRSGTGSREEPDRRSVDAGDYFSDGFNRKLMSTSESPLATALRTQNGNADSAKRLSAEQKASLSAYLSTTAQIHNERRAEVFFGAVGGAISSGVGALVSGYAAKALASGAAVEALQHNPHLGPLSGAVVNPVGRLFETPGREAGEAFGRWLDPKIEQFKNDTKYDSRMDPRFNPLGWPYD